MLSVKVVATALGCIFVLSTSGASALLISQSSQKVSADPGPPRMLASLGCDGSTAILIHAYAILPLHGVNPGAVETQKELLDPKRNPFYDEAGQDIVAAMELLADKRKNDGETLVFKSIFGRDRDATLDRRMVKDMGGHVLVSTRRNVLDKLVCMVRDCFLDEWYRDDVKLEDTQYGYPVNDRGNLNRLCFRRRASDDVNTTKAQLVASELASNLEWLTSQDDKAVEELKQAGYDAPRVLYEDMLAFEEDPANIPISVEAWSDALKAWGMEPSPQKLEEYFRKEAGSRPPAEPHSELIWNINEIKAELESHGKMDLYRP